MLNEDENNKDATANVMLDESQGQMFGDDDIDKWKDNPVMCWQKYI